MIFLKNTMYIPTIPLIKLCNTKCDTIACPTLFTRGFCRMRVKILLKKPAIQESFGCIKMQMLDLKREQLKNSIDKEPF